MKNCWFIYALVLAPAAWGQDPLALTSQGLVRGFRADEGSYSTFLGIPYAAVDPSNPFGLAISPPYFRDVFEANNDTAMCPQIDDHLNSGAGTLDCLTLNVYVPASASSVNLLPVMVWIHGGGFQSGSASHDVYGPQYIVQNDVILVTLNYRLGPYGFLCLDVPSVSGNTGLKDQRAALRWVNENIAAFGGNADSITIFGHGAGAHSVEFHILSAGSSGLFNRAILQSGSTLSEYSTGIRTYSAPVEIAQHFGFITEDTEKALAFITFVQPDQIVAAVKELGITFGPCVEIAFDGVESLFTTSSLNILASRMYDSVPMLFGYTDYDLPVHNINMNDECNGVDIYENVILEKIDEHFDFPNLEVLAKSAQIVKEFYVGVNRFCNNIESFLRFQSDFDIYHPMERSLQYHLGKSNQPIYQYMFAYNSERNSTEDGAFQADDFGYLFHQSYMPQEISPADQLVMDRMIKMWTNFAKYGNPTPSVTELVPVLWPASSLASHEYLLISSELSTARRPHHERMAFWDLFYAVYGKYQSGCA